MSPDTLSVGLRSVLFLCLFQAAGAALFLLVFGSRLESSSRFIRRLALWAASGGWLLIAAHQFVEAARLAGDFTGLSDASLQRLALRSSGAAAHLAQALGLLLIAAGRRSRVLLAMGVALAIGSFALTGHTSVHPLRAWLVPLLCLHLAIVAFWSGALLPLLAVLRKEPLELAQRVFERFSKLAAWLVPLIALAGLAMACLLVPDVAVLWQPYGELLTLKLALFGVLMVLAALNKWRLVPGLRDTAGGDAGTQLVRSLLAEYLLIAAVLCVTAVLTTFYSPEG